MFFILLAILGLFAGFLVAWPLLARSFVADVSSRALNRQVYEDRMAELEADKVAGVLEEGEYDALRTELARTLLVDTADEVATGKASGSRRAGVTVMMLVTVLGLAFYMAVQFKPVLLEWWSLQSRIGSQVDQVLAGQPPEGKPDYSLLDFARVLQVRVQASPEKPDLWTALGMSYFQLQAPSLAADAFDRANRLSPGRPEVELGLAQSRFYANEGKLDEETTALVQSMLARNPQDDGARVLLATSAFNSGDYVSAKRLFGELLASRGDTMGAEARQMVESRLAESERLLKEKTSPVVARSLLVSVRIAPEVRQSLSPDATLFVFAKAASGPPMPLAVARFPLGQAPSEVLLDDSLAMMPAMRLSAFQEVVVSAHVSRNGQAKTESGDYRADVVNVRLSGGRQPVSLTIDKKVP